MVRIKNRYLVVNYLYPTTSTTSKSNDSLPDFIQFHQPTPDQFHVGLLLKAIRDGVTELFGEYGMGMISANMKVNYHSTATSTSIIRCPQAHYEMIWAVLTCMTRLPKPVDVPVVVRVVRVSGTIRKAEEEVIRRAKEIILRARTAEEGAAEEGPLGDIMRAIERGKEGVVLDLEGEEEDVESSSASE